MKEKMKEKIESNNECLLKNIEDIICSNFQITREMLTSKPKEKHVLYANYVFSYIMRELGYSFSRISEKMKCSVGGAFKKVISGEDIMKFIKTKKYLIHTIKKIREELESSGVKIKKN